MGVETPILDDTELAISYRNYQKDFQSFLASGFGERSSAPQNEEGLMVSVMYDGRNVIPENNENRTVKNIDYIKEDNGKFILNNSIFDDIPNHALLDLMLLRGNVQIEEYDEETYKIFAESHQTISLVLIRDMNTVVTE
jgi:hypothetical protein